MGKPAARVGVFLALLACCSCRPQPAFTIPVCDARDVGCRCMLSGFTNCNSVCVQLAFDHESCGWCGHGCGSGVCWNGACAEDCNGLARCGNACKYQDDPFHCGAFDECGTTCDYGCSDGECVTEVGGCPLGLTKCLGECVSLNDLRNCGRCGHVCSALATRCIDGVCR